MKNVGGWDRNTRWILGSAALLAGLAAPLPKSWRIGLLAFGATEFLTAGSQYCPVNQLLGINTRRGEFKELVRKTAEALL